MDKLRIIGGTELHGRIVIGGAKNAALPLMCASLLTSEKVTLENVPYLADITTMAKLLMQHGVLLSMRDPSGGLFAEGDTQQGRYSRELTLHAKEITSVTAPYELVCTMRASILVLGPLLAREGRAKVSLPGGCAIGTRPIDMHLAAMEALGAKITLEEGYVLAEAPQGLKGAEIHFEKVSVGATENVLMAASLAQGTTMVHNAAREPEITDLADMLNSMGANIEGAGTSTITIRGVAALSGTTHRVIADRIETGSYLAAVAMAGGELELVDARLDTLGNVIAAMEQVGVHTEQKEDYVRVWRNGSGLKPMAISTQPYPDFPTDMQAQMMTILTQAEGDSPITETIFENRFMHVPELARMGANISVAGNTATVHGRTKLKGAPVMATDLRASVSLVIAALGAEGETIVSRIYHLDRGYERLEEKLTLCGAKISRIR
ncbi:MAG: UDP-N-acetylglucosamine 1-carboxyvinyltransferase [Rickettsiales bacterium]